MRVYEWGERRRNEGLPFCEGSSGSSGSSESSESSEPFRRLPTRERISRPAKQGKRGEEKKGETEQEKTKGNTKQTRSRAAAKKMQDETDKTTARLTDKPPRKDARASCAAAAEPPAPRHRQRRTPTEAKTSGNALHRQSPRRPAQGGNRL